MFTRLAKILPYFILVRWLKSRSSMDYATLVITSFGSKKEEMKGKIKMFDSGEILFIEDVSELLQKRSKIRKELSSIEDKISKYGAENVAPQT